MCIMPLLCAQIHYKGFANLVSLKILLEHNYCPLLLSEETEAQRIQVSVQGYAASNGQSRSLHAVSLGPEPGFKDLNESVS